MTEEKPRATLSDGQARGGVIGGRGYGFQAAYIVSRIPDWLADPDFAAFLQEGAGDVDVRFSRPGHEERWYIQVKNYQVTPAIARDVFAEFQKTDRGSPGTYTFFYLACPGFHDRLQRLRSAVKELRGAAPLYQSGRDEILDNTWADLEDLVTSLKLPVDARFLVDKVRFDTNLAGLTDDESLSRQFVGGLLKLGDWQGIAPAGLFRAYEKLALLCHQALRETYSREQVEAKIREAVSEVPVTPDQLFAVPFMWNPDFVGREEDLERLHRALTGEGPGPGGRGQRAGSRPVGLTGMGGIGKTQMAVEYAYRYAAAYGDGVFWINAAEPLTQGFAQLGQRVSKETADRPLEEQIRAAGGYLRQHPDVLLILDNLAEPASLNRPVSVDLVPAGLPCRVLFTTRRRDVDRFTAIEVTELPEDAALRLLLRHPSRQLLLNPDHAEHEEARKICAMLGYLPLALELAGAHLGRREKAPVAAYREELLARGALHVLDDPRAGIKADNLPTRHEAAVAATLTGQWGTLENDDASLLLRVAGQLPEASLIPSARLGLLAGLDGQEGGFFGSPLVLALEELESASLIEGLREGQLRLHPLVREFAASRTPEKETPDFRRWCAANLAAGYSDIATLEDHCARRGIDALQEDVLTALSLLPATMQAPTSGDPLGYLRPLLRLLQREAHNLRGWDPERRPAFFGQQVHNRAVTLGLVGLAAQAQARLGLGAGCALLQRWRTNSESPALERTLTGHADAVMAVAVTPDGRRAVSASDDRSLKVWDLASGQVLGTLTGHADAVVAVAVTPDGHRAVSASDDGNLKVWDLASGQELATLTGHADTVKAVAVTPDGRCAVSASRDRSLKVWDLASGRELTILTGHTDAVNAVAVMADGYRALSASADCSLKVWDLATGQELATLIGHEGAVNAVAVTPDGRRAVSASDDRGLKVWDLASGQELATLTGHADRVRAVAVTPDGLRAVSASDDRSLKVWDVSSQLNAGLPSGQELATLTGHAGWVRAVAVTPDGRWAVSASRDRSLKVWDISPQLNAGLASGQELATLIGHEGAVRAVAVTPDGRRAVSASDDRSLKVWDLASGQELATLTGHADRVRAVAVTPDGHRAVSASDDRSLKVWDVSPQLNAGLASSQELATLTGHAGWVSAVAVTPDGRWAVSASADRSLKVWDLALGRELATLTGHAGWVRAVAVTPDGRRVVSASDDRSLKVWDISPQLDARLYSGRELATLSGHEGPVFAVAVTPDGRRAVSASADRSLKEWDLASGQELATLAGHAGWVYAVAVTPDGRRAVSVSGNRSLKVWDLASGRELATALLEGGLDNVTIAPDGITIVTGDAAGHVYCLRYTDPALER